MRFSISLCRMIWDGTVSSIRVWRHSGNVWRRSGNILRQSGNIWRHSGNICRHSENMSRYSRNIQTVQRLKADQRFDGPFCAFPIEIWNLFDGVLGSCSQIIGLLNESSRFRRTPDSQSVAQKAHRSTCIVSITLLTVLKSICLNSYSRSRSWFDTYGINRNTTSSPIQAQNLSVCQSSEKSVTKWRFISYCCA
jgi:hypothetical protein